VVLQSVMLPLSLTVIALSLCVIQLEFDCNHVSNHSIECSNDAAFDGVSEKMGLAFELDFAFELGLHKLLRKCEIRLEFL